MKSLSYILVAFLLLITYGCEENDKPYSGYIVIDRVTLNTNGDEVSVTPDTDLSYPIQILGIDAAGAEWCTVSVAGNKLLVSAKTPNPSTEGMRTAKVDVRCGTRVSQFLVVQQYKGQQFIELDWTGWVASGSDVQSDDGGGYPSLLTTDRTTFWHSQYSPALANPLPHWLKIDMKKEFSMDFVRIGRRHYAGNGNNYPTVKTMEVYTSKDNEEYTLVGKSTFALPWTAPDGTVVNGNSPKIPPYEEIQFDSTITARYIKIVITETNNTNGNCQVSYIQPFIKF